VILWILKAKYAEDQYSVDFPQFLLLFSYFTLIIYIVEFSGGAGPFNKLILVDSTQVLRSWRAEWNCYFDPRYHTVHSYSTASLLIFLRAKDCSVTLIATHHWNYNHYSIQLFFAALLHLSAVKVRAMQFGEF